MNITANEMRKLTATAIENSNEASTPEWKFIDIFVQTQIENAAKCGKLSIEFEVDELSNEYAEKVIAATKFKKNSKGYNKQFDKLVNEFEYLLNNYYTQYLLARGFLIETSYNTMFINWSMENLSTI